MYFSNKWGMFDPKAFQRTVTWADVVTLEPAEDEDDYLFFWVRLNDEVVGLVYPCTDDYATVVAYCQDFDWQSALADFNARQRKEAQYGKR